MFITWRAFLLVVLGLAAVITLPSMATVIIVALLAALVVLADGFAAVSPRRLVVGRREPGTVRLTTGALSVIQVANPTRQVARLLVRDAWVPSAGSGRNRHPLSVPSGSQREVTTELQPTRRGTLRSGGITVRSLGRLGLAGRQLTFAIDTRLQVLPEFASRVHLPSRLALLREMDGRTVVNIRGGGSEFDSLREYAIGDDVRSIDWRATARRADVMVRTWRPERDRRVVIVVDTSRLSAARLEETTRLESNIEAALLLTALANEAGDRVEVIAFDRQQRAHTTMNGSDNPLATIGGALSDVQPELVELNWNGLLGLLSSRLNRRSLVVLLTALDSGAQDDLIEAASYLSGRHQVLVGSATDPHLEQWRSTVQSTDDVYLAAAASRRLLHAQATTDLLVGTGAAVTSGAPDELAPRVADEYLRLKREGRL